MARKSNLPPAGQWTSEWWEQHTDRLPFDTVAFLVYLWTCPYRKIEGIYKISIGRMQLETKLDTDDILRRIEALEAAGYIEYDAPARVMLLKGYMPMQSNLQGVNTDIITGMLNGISELCPVATNGIIEAWYDELKALPHIQEAIAKRV